MEKLGIIGITLLVLSISARAQQAVPGVPPPKPVTYKYRCILLGPSDLVRNWTSMFGEPKTVIMFNTTQRTVYFLGGMASYTIETPGSATWNYEDLITHRRMTATFNGDTNEMYLQEGNWRCDYEGPGP
jgi:hypothetical protein